ncbi:MAG: hypothetical protein AAFU61_12170 [Pseudomonadota bacterium]
MGDSLGARVVLRALLVTGAALFAAMAFSHWNQIKVPIMFVYYDVPSEPYQDKIIAFCLAAYSLFFVGAALHRGAVPFAWAGLVAAVAGLSALNLSADLAAALPEGGTTLWYWVQTGVFAVFALLIGWLWTRARWE